MGSGTLIYDSVIALSIVAFNALILFYIKKVYRRYFWGFTFIVTSVTVLVVSMLFVQFPATEPSGWVTYVRNATYVSGNATTTRLETVTVPYYSNVTTNIMVSRSLLWISITVSLVSALLGFALLLIPLINDILRSSSRL